MQHNTHCALCAAQVTRVLTETNEPLYIKPTPDADLGYIYVVGYELGTPVVRVVGRSEEVPGTEPLRYVHHVCS